jgi:hypothetical protein
MKKYFVLSALLLVIAFSVSANQNHDDQSQVCLPNCPTPTPTVSPSPSVTPEPTVEPSPSPTPEVTPTPEPSGEPTPSITPEPSVTPSPTPEITESPSPTPTSVSAPESTPTPRLGGTILTCVMDGTCPCLGLHDAMLESCIKQFYPGGKWCELAPIKTCFADTSGMCVAEGYKCKYAPTPSPTPPMSPADLRMLKISLIKQLLSLMQQLLGILIHR